MHHVTGDCGHTLPQLVRAPKTWQLALHADWMRVKSCMHAWMHATMMVPKVMDGPWLDALVCVYVACLQGWEHALVHLHARSFIEEA